MRFTVRGFADEESYGMHGIEDSKRGSTREEELHSNHGDGASFDICPWMVAKAIPCSYTAAQRKARHFSSLID